MARTAKPIPPGDLDLDEKSNFELLGEVAALTVYLSQTDAWRLRRVRAFRVLRARDVPRGKLAELAGMTSGAIGNLIDDLNRGEAVYEAQRVVRSCGRCGHAFDCHQGRREHPLEKTKGCVPLEGVCYCVEFVEPEEEAPGG